jgi:SAM-dependent methyltransferase
MVFRRTDERLAPSGDTIPPFPRSGLFDDDARRSGRQANATRRGAYAAHVGDLSPRLRAIVDALPLRPGLRVIEVGCGPGATVREVARRVTPGGHVLAVDRSPKAIEQLTRTAADLIEAGVVSVMTTSVEEFAIDPDEARYDLAFAVRVGVLDGRHPDREPDSLTRLRRALTPDGRLFVDGGDPLREVPLVRCGREPMEPRRGPRR